MRLLDLTVIRTVQNRPLVHGFPPRPSWPEQRGWAGCVGKPHSLSSTSCCRGSGNSLLENSLAFAVKQRPAPVSQQYHSGQTWHMGRPRVNENTFGW
jgi:hypothetical protein